MKLPNATASWGTRAARATQLAEEQPAMVETLRFYAALAELQGDLASGNPFVTGLRASARAVAAIQAFIASIARIAPPALCDAIHAIDDWPSLIETYWSTAGREPHGIDDRQSFLVEAILQPLAQTGALPSPVSPARPASPACPFCNGPPLVALLREEGHGARRSLVCPICLAERPAQRLVCVACSESQFEALPVFTSEDFPAVRIDACDSCKTYIKTIDLTRDGHADAIVDDLASVPLDLWAREQAYQRVRPNLLRL